MTNTLVDARGLKCPLPVLKTEKALELLSAGSHLTVLATDPMARIDIAHFCQQKGYQCAVSGTDELRFDIVKPTAS